MFMRRAILGRCMRSAALAMLGAAALAGCSAQRPLPTVQEQGMRAMERADYARAAQEFEEYVDRKPEDDSIRFALGQAYMQLKRPRDARREFEYAYDVHPERDSYAEALADAMLAAEQHTDLLAFLTRRNSERGRVSDYIRHGTYAARVGHADEALVAFKTAAKIDAGQTAAPHLALASFYEGLGDMPSSVRRLRMALYLEPGNREIMQRLERAGEIMGPSLPLRPEETP